MTTALDRLLSLTQMQLPIEYSQETRYVEEMKRALVALGDEKGDRVCVTFKLNRARHAQLLAAVDRQGMTITDVLTLHIDQILPVLMAATPIEVPGLKKDGRTIPGRPKKTGTRH